MLAAPRISRSGAAAAPAALLLVQLALGYEWLVSGLTKAVHGDFAAGLAHELKGMPAEGWYRGFLGSVVEPHAVVVAYAIEAAELAIGATLCAAAFSLLLGRPTRLQRAVGLASLVAVALLVNFELANGGHFGLALGKDSFDEGVDLDTMMIGLQLVVLCFAPGVARVSPAG
jgi:thiosulfate dehydrogenase [quinone] large subunit